MDVAKMGRPELPPEERADERLSVAVTSAEKELVQRAAEADGYTSVSRWIADNIVRRAKTVVKKVRR